ncbi:class I SAM-dependent methyltransferase [Robertkochia flava]|uniref:class I SAM-dependent methyltransferase n=1 Tax=Robertkochia flava TaxID=3447986 RepID=UPI001CCECABC|nr:class I SAM-dependent methyltransferase [Robertkochia marina]
MEVHETAFVTCAFRAMHEELSQDPYARLWIDEPIRELSQQYLQDVTPEESVAHSLRNRFFLDTLKHLVKHNQVEFLINFGCGFSMYPFLLPDTLKHIEIDLPNVIDYKQQRIDYWQKKNTLPQRDIHHIGCNFGSDDFSVLLEKIRSIKGTASSFILLEGVLFFLNGEQTDDLFNLFREIQAPNDTLGSVSFRQEDTGNLAFQRLLQFIKSVSGDPHAPVHYQTVEDTFYKQLPSYRLSDHQDFYSMADTSGYQPRHKPDMIINEQFYVLTRTS